MKTRIPKTFLIAAVLSCLGSFAVHACEAPINLAAIDKRMADPNLDSDVKAQATVLRKGAVAAIEAGERYEGQRMYRKVMTLLGIASFSGPYRCG